MGCGASAHPSKDGQAKPTDTPAAKPAEAPAAAPAAAAEKPAEAKPADAAPAAAPAAEAAPAAAAPAPAAEAAPAAAAAPAAEAPAAAPAAEAAAEPKKEVQVEEKAEVIGEEEESEDEELDMDEEEFERQMAARAATSGPRGTRCAVSAESAYDDRDDFEAPEYEKTPEQEEKLTKSLSRSFMFAALSGDDLPVVIKAFAEHPVKAGDTVITQGTAVDSIGPALFVLESGKLSVYKDGSEEAVTQYTEAGQYFGELALLYNAPRAATVKAVEDSVLWSLDRDTFTYLVKDAAKNAAKTRMQFLEQVPILKGLTAEEKAKACDVMNVQIVPKGDFVIKQGEVGKIFYILESGKAEARVDGNKVKDYDPKDYFGELALLKDAPRAADVVCTELSKVLSLDQASFKRIIGSLEEIMKERAASYGTTQ